MDISAQHVWLSKLVLFLCAGVIQRTNSDEGTVVNLALDFVVETAILPDVSLKAYSRSIEVSSSGLDYILAGAI